VLELRALHAGVEHLRLRGGELRFRLHDVDAADHTDGELVARQLQRALVAGGGFVEQRDRRVLHAQQQKVDDDVGLRRELDRFEIGDARLGARRIAFDGAAHAAPQVDFPVHVERDAEVVADVAAAVDADATAAAGRGRCAWRSRSPRRRENTQRAQLA
jgi:hypothetical protein